MSLRERIAAVIVLWVLLIELSGGAIGGTPSPIPDLGTRVLITYSDAGKQSLPRPQLALIDSPTLRTWLDANCVKNAKGDPEWRIVPDTVTFGPDQPILQKLMVLPRGKSEWITVADGKRGTSQPLPPDEPTLMPILTPYGGGK